MNTSQEPLDQLVARLAEGDRSAFTPCFRALWPRVHGLCVTLLGHPQDADDAAQQAMEKVLTRAAEYDPGRPALPWALGIAAWECRTLRRRKLRRREASEEILHDAASELDPDAELARGELGRLLHGAMGELSESDRDTLVRSYFQEAEGALSPTIRKRKQRALERLRLAFRRLYEPG